jgi:hypothetical protein
MRSTALAALAALLLAGCGGGGGEDFTVEVRQPLASVYAPLASASIADAAPVFPGIEVRRTRPSDREILYTIPGTASTEASVLFRLETLPDGKGTAIHTTVEVPAVQATIGGQTKVLSERKVEAALRTLLHGTGRNLEMGSGGEGDTRQLSALLLALAIGTNQKYLDQALALKDDPQGIAEILAALGGPPESAMDDGAPRDDGRPMDNPDMSAEREGFAQAREQWREQEAMESAAEPMDDVGEY